MATTTATHHRTSSHPPLPDDELMDRIRRARALPSPPVVAARLIELGEDPHAGLNQLVEVLRADPALSARLLRLANSPLYARRRRAENLHQAVVMLGMDAVFTAALSLTLMSDRKALGSSSLSFQDRWTRSVHAAVASQLLATRAGRVIPGDAFLAGLLQDIGILVVGRLGTDTYAELDGTSRHSDFVACEIEQLGVDHAVIGGALLESWNLPPHIVDAVRRSHVGGSAHDDTDRLVNCVAVGGLIADWMNGEPDQLFAARGAANSLLGLDDAAFSKTMDDVAATLPELAPTLEAKVPPTDVLTELAADAIVARQLAQRHTIDQMQEDLADLTEVTRQLEIASRTDGLTGLLNRRHLDALLEQQFADAKHLGHGIAVLFVDLDEFKAVNDAFGHHAGDVLLRSSAERVADAVRDADLVGRYGGDEFIVVLPATLGDQAEVVAERLLLAFASAPFQLEHGIAHEQRVSIGVAATDQIPVERVDDLVRAADSALFSVKRAGKSGWANASGDGPPRLLPDPAAEDDRTSD